MLETEAYILPVRFASSAKVFPHADGQLQTLINHPADFLHALPDSCSYEEGALVEPLSVVLHAARRAQITAGQRVLVFGAGAVGLLGSSVASAFGATQTVVVDINEERVNSSVSRRKSGHGEADSASYFGTICCRWRWVRCCSRVLRRPIVHASRYLCEYSFSLGRQVLSSLIVRQNGRKGGLHRHG